VETNAKYFKLLKESCKLETVIYSSFLVDLKNS